MDIRVKRVYREAEPSDGARILVDRLWPRGLSKGKARLDAWMRDVAPSDGLRRWYGHDAEKWEEFRRRYFAELAERGEALEELLRAVQRRHVTLLFAARDEARNNAVALAEYLERRTEAGDA